MRGAPHNEFSRHMRRMGAVRLTGLGLADLRRSGLSRGELTPFGERCGAVLLEDFPTVEVALLVEMIVD
jgi:hypothetical protein